MSPLDAILLILLVPFAFRGWWRGLCRETLGLVGLCGGVLAAAAAGPELAKAILERRLLPPVAALPVAWIAIFVGAFVVADLRGRSAVGLCPFHVEKTPSFTVSEERGFYHCFGCGEHGDVFAFVMKTESLAFPEAVRRVAERFGVPLPEERADARRTAEPLAAMNALAAAFFRAELAGTGGVRARAYLRERGLTDEVVERFGIGFAPGSGQAFAQHVRARGLRMDDAIAAGLVVRREAPAGVYDRFRDRIVFPIADATGKVIAFG